VVVLADGGPCLGTCEPDPGWRAVDCKPASGIETLAIVNFNEANNNNFASSAGNTYSYSDGTAGRLVFAYGDPRTLVTTANDAGWQPPTMNLPPGSVIPGDAGLCAPKNTVLHVLGGPFRGWGGGIGVAMQKLNGRAIDDPSTTGDPNRLLCVSTIDKPEHCPPTTAEYAVRVGALDVSRFDGISWWARRGPNSQVGLRVNVGDKHTDDDLNYLAYHHSIFTHRPLCETGQPSGDCEPIYCQRVRECACRTHKACTYYAVAPLSPSDPPGFYCGSTPEEVLQSTGAGAQGSGSDDNRFCDRTACDRPYAAFPNDVALGRDGGPVPAPDGGTLPGDPKFFGRPCTPYAWPNGVGSSYCFDPEKDPPPAPDTEICGDHFMTTVNLSTEWQFYRVPFTDLRQQGFGKRAPQLDLTSVSLVRFTWDVGYIDYWIDDVSFYRMAQ
jgi:hypothetical protein